MTDSERELNALKSEEIVSSGLLKGSEPGELRPNRNGNDYSLLQVPDSAPKFRIMETTVHKIVLKVGVNTAAPMQCLDVFSLSGERVASMDFAGVVTSHVEDPVKELNMLLESDEFRDNYIFAQLRSYLLLLRAYFLLPQPDSWKKNPLL